MPFRCHHRFAHDMREIGADCEIPIQTDSTQGWSGNETSTDSKESAEDADNKADDHEINRADMGVGNWEKHGLFRTPAKKPQQKRGYILKHNGLTNDEQNRDAGVSVAMLMLEPMQPASQKIQNQKEIADNEQRIDA